MPASSAAWIWLRRNVHNHAAELSLSVRVTVSAVLTLTVSQALGLPLPLWGVLTSVILTQMSVGRSLKATVDYLLGTLGGAAYAGVVGSLVPHSTAMGLTLVVAIAVAPVALLAAKNPRLSAAPVTSAMVVLAPSLIHLGPIASALDRVVEVALGGVIGLIVSVFVLPARAHSLVIENAARMLDLIGRLLPALIAGFTRDLDEAELRRMQDEIGRALAGLNAIAVEARHERMTRLGEALDQGPLLRTLLRLRHDVIMIGRAAVVPLAADFQARLGPPLDRIAQAVAEYLNASASALVERRPAPSLARCDTALEAYTVEIAAMRREGSTRRLSDEAVERIFALGFALEQMHQHLADLGRFVGELAQTP